MLSRWALKHVFRFILKKKLGKIILGDIDLDQLDVQLGAGSIELHDLALNVEYLNQKLRANPVMVKDGSIGSLSVKIPWNMSNCEVEIKDLEIVLSPQSVEKVPGAVEHMPSRRVEKPSVSGSPVKIGDGGIHQDASFTPSDVHEGVKTIANLVKCLLSNFHVKVNNLLLALDPNLKKPGKTSHSYGIMVFRITELTYGTCLSESAQTHPDSGLKTDGFLGLTKLTNFATFREATMELLEVIDEESQSDFSGASRLGISQSCKPIVPPIPVFTGENGLCGTLKLSMPWKNGSLDISRVDAEFHIDPVELRFYPSSIQFIIFLWDSFKFLGRNDNGSTNCNAVGSETGLRLITNMKSHIGVETSPTVTHLILDWVPVGIAKDKNAGAEVEPDFGASVNQFFDCLDGISYQSALSSSDIWNWTCSVFSTISAASSLASGSLHIPTEQQHVETNINATIAGVSIILSFHDETQNGYNDMKSSGEIMYINNMNSAVESVHLEKQNMLPEQKTGFYNSVHYLEANLQGLNVTFRIFPQEVKFEAVLKQITVNDCFNFEGKATDPGLLVNGDELFREVNLVHSLQSEIQGSLPPFPFSFQDHPDTLKNVSQLDTAVTNLHLEPVDAKVQGDAHRPISRAKYVKMNILRTSTLSKHLISVISRHANGKIKASTSFFVHLPPIIMWLNLNTVNMLLDLCNQIGETALPNLSRTSDASSHGPQEYKGFDKKSGDMANPTVVSVQGNIVLAETRTIVCFPLRRCGDSRNLYFHNNFAVFDLCPSESTDIAGETYHVQNGCSGGSLNYMPSTSIHLNIGSFNVYLISKPDRNTSEGNSFVYNGQAFSAKEIFSSIAGTCGKCSGVFMIWKADAVTDMHIAKRAWDMATSRNFSRNKDSRRKCEFASVATVSDQEGISSQVHQELISASGFSFRIHFARAIVNLGHTEYALLVHLISQIVDVFSNGSSEKNDVNTREDLSKDKLQSHDVKFCQSSFLLECDVLDISVKLEEALDVNTSIQKELPGSWASARLTVQNFELLSGSNVGGMPSSSILWVSHGEGELWGSIVNTAGEVTGTSEDLMLLCARNSAMHRGDGGGANALSSGFAGISIVHLSYPHMLQTSTSITLKCGTLVAPGSRLDWLAAISSFFCVPASDGACSSDADGQKNFPQKEKVYESSFFLELLDVGLSYEPYQKGVKVGKEGVKPACPDPMKSTGRIGEQGVACLLAAASLYVCSRNSDGATSNDYKIGIQDIGLLLSDLPALGYLVDYDVRYLHENNYVKVAGETLVEVILKTDLKDDTWQLTCSGCHVKINTCHDTTAGLICLGTQLQQLFAPDITESVLHLQTRWNTVMQANNDRDDTKLFGGDTFTSPLIVQASSIDEGSNSSPLGLMDEILDDVFREEAAQSLSLSEPLSNHPSSSETVPDNECFLHTSKNGNTPLKASTNLLHQPEEGNLSKSSPNCLPEFIDDYYVLDTFSAQNPGGYHKHSEAGPSSRVTSSASNVDNGKSGWYEDGSFCILENHIPIVNHHEGCIDSASFEHFSSTFASLAEELKRKGRIILENVNVTWAMFAGSDWSSSTSEVSKTGGRDTTKCLELSLLGMNIEYDIFPDGKLNVSNLSVSVQDFHVYDSSKEAPWKMVLGSYHSKLHPRESHAKAVNLILETVKPDPLIPLEEYRLRLSLLPLRLHLHQSQVDFLVSFFSLGHPSSDQFSSVPNDLGRPCTFATSVSQLNVVEEALLPFFQKCDIYPSILCVDYVPQHVDLAALGGGNYVELLNLVPWKGIELRLKYVHAAGIYGWNSVCETVIGEWLEDISHNQVCELIKGLVPVRSLCSVGSGAAKLISLPVASYRKDHKLLKGLQRGAIAFLRSVSLEAVALGVHLAGGAHDMLFQTEYILQNVPRSIHTASRDNGDAAVRVNQPNNAQEGVQQAYKTLAHGFGKSASALVGNPIKSYNRGASAGSALASAAKSAPAAAVAPATAAVGAIHCALLGVRNSLDPERKRESMEKYSGPSRLHHKPMR